MAETTLLSPSLSRFPIPADRAVYRDLSTDHYPWTEVSADFEARQDEGFSGLLDIWQGERWARFALVQGVARSGFTQGGHEVGWAAAMQAMPRAHVTLSRMDSVICDLIWSLRGADTPIPLKVPWPAAQHELQRVHFTGALVSQGSCSYWKGGQLLEGTLPQSGAACHMISTYRSNDREGTLNFWQELLRTVNSHVPLAEPWRQATLALSDEYPCLDPFAQEVVLTNGILEVEPELELQELRPALSAVLLQMMNRAGVRLADLPLGALRQRPEWASAELEVS
ncbi:hypothetical protein DEDE109153_00130 [Deinococcus deserti]|uniref:Uncharacterized protein n=1 Tax=Deinococcus deserti (strain DSM 17065 / CIP 109153 / LMG 22923 / VCD115) TaxID=546414 RepID=C1CW57_DEIDV|nr:hypothetical protein [Deinococcus deserti]ACO46424.1 hypothetical protein Deide_14710 [Deinococcus deserti VCD115]